MSTENQYPIVIQGLTTYCEEVVNYYKNYECVWSTWNTEPKENLDYIKSNPNFTLITSDVPEHTVSGIYIWQATLNAFEYLKKRNIDFAIRVRSDMLVDISSNLKITKYDHFNCWGWHRHNVGYLCDFYFSGPVNLIYNLMLSCTRTRIHTFPENILTYSLLQENNWRKINYTLSDETKFMWIKDGRRGKSQDFYMDHVRKGEWYNTIETFQDSFEPSINYIYSKDYFPDNYKLHTL